MSCALGPETTELMNYLCECSPASLLISTKNARNACLVPDPEAKAVHWKSTSPITANPGFLSPGLP